ncbi:MAG TPA: molybdopterin molybdotransferase MoeA [Dehalococcoidia bacterium]|nr:molybdopterin molybdotransferase MoeA [Dehalococcoidia bacterium]
MISVEEALEKLLSNVDVLAKEEVAILDSLGQVLADDIYSDVDVPPLDNSAMDGYAVQSSDTLGAGPHSPRLLHVIDTVAAGSISESEVTAGIAVRIMTGAPVPKGADTVIRFEDTDEVSRREISGGQTITEIGILCEAEVGLNIRRAGEDISRGSRILAAGTVIRPAEVGVLASLGRSQVTVISRPVVAILSTGDELVEVGQPLPAGKIYNSNSYSVAALVRRYGAVPRMLGIALDSEDSLVTALRRGLDADMLITSGGVSVGDYDVVKDVLAKEGEIGFWTVRMKPGKPLAFGTIRGSDRRGVPRRIPHLGLPGNPVSSMVTFEVFARPAVFKMMGKKDWTKPTVEAVLEDGIVNTGGRRVFTRAVVEKREGRYFARLTGPQGSGVLTSMSQANGLAIVPEDWAEARPGDIVKVMMLDWNEEVI